MNCHLIYDIPFSVCCPCKMITACIALPNSIRAPFLLHQSTVIDRMVIDNTIKWLLHQFRMFAF